MEDRDIIGLFRKRSEDAINETAKKYGKYCHYIAYNILYNEQDSEECVNDTYLNAWDNIPPHNPDKLSAYLGKITRNLALNKWDYYNASKRGKGQFLLVLEELQECISSADTTEKIVDELHFANTLNSFLASLPKQKRIVFLRRYWYMSSIKEICADFGMSESKVKMMLMRLRNDFRVYLEKEGISV
ncbi:MAG: sigma-70 family RNA polymerase sigma factor [Lachnospiraceae bacterium]|nr:sigma-70 family RNA polymerase sigma factor [Lachnospiraceae bacterium]MBR4084134.1 sigma-70 family RNA polymerase sigma factor [Lachnospiraceae bacterium]